MIPLTIVADGLKKVTLPPLTRPAVGPNDDPTEELVFWGINYYTRNISASSSATVTRKTAMDG